MNGSVRKKLPLVSVVILNWNRIDDTLTCLKSIRKQTYSNYEVVVVDNGSTDESKKVLGNFDDIIFVNNSNNRGFTGGHIDGLLHARGEFIFILNNDAVVDRDYISNAVSLLETNDKIGIIGGRSYRWTSGSKVNHKSPFYAFQTINRITMEGIFNNTDSGFDHEVNWVSGSAMVIRRSALEKSGYFYEPMFAYYEESDLFARIQANDYIIVYSPNLKIWHKDGASSSSLFQLTSLFKNRFVYASRNLNKKAFLKFLRSYVRLIARGSIYYVLKLSKNEDEEIFNKALSVSLGQTAKKWPKWLLSRRSVKKKDSRGFDLSDRLKIEQTGVSFVFDGDITRHQSILRNYIEKVAFHHFNSEFIFIVNKGQKSTVESFKQSLTCSSIVKIVINRQPSTKNRLNLGWLSATKQYVMFVDIQNLPVIESLDHFCLMIPDKQHSLYVETSVLSGVSASFSIGKNVLVSRSLLALHGGVDGDAKYDSLARIFWLALHLGDAGVYRTIIPTNASSQKFVISPEAILQLKFLAHEYNYQKRKRNRYSKLLERYYRLYQFHNLITWLFIWDYTPRHKVARTYNVISSTITLNRKRLATELKHISNEVIKSKSGGIDKKGREEYIANKASLMLKDDAWKFTPVFIICRDRLSPLLELINWLELNGMKNIILIDNDSIYPPLVSFLSNTAYQVIRTGKNIGHTVVWHEGVAKTLFPGEFYIVSDPDVIPDKDCPDNAIPYFYDIHRKYPDYQKVGFGLQIDDLPDFYILKNEVVNWESQFWKNELEQNIFDASLDTTFSLYKPYTDFYMLSPSIRTGRPYTARHLPWYVNSSLIDDEEAFYRAHASQEITSWNVDEIMDRYQKELSK